MSTIAIVDDDDDVRQATGGLLRSLGFRIATFATAEAFLNSGQLHETSCLITDVQMPGLNGFGLQDRLIAQGHRIPIIFITGFPEDGVRARAMKAGAVCFLGKPYKAVELFDCLHKSLRSVSRLPGQRAI